MVPCYRTSRSAPPHPLHRRGGHFGAFLDNLAKGRPVYDVNTLRSYVRADLALLEAVKPDLVVGDFRISLGVSARVAGIPYWTVTKLARLDAVGS